MIPGLGNHFKEMVILPAHYFIKSAHERPGWCHLKS
jgi:hypothetical protein